MQRLPLFSAEETECLDALFREFPKLQVAYVDERDVHGTRTFYSCLVDAACPYVGGRREPKYVIELPGHPILGHGKGDNQNHVLPASQSAARRWISPLGPP